MDNKEYLKAYIKELEELIKNIDNWFDVDYFRLMIKDAEAKLNRLQPMLIMWTPVGEVSIEVKESFENMDVLQNYFNLNAKTNGIYGFDKSWIVPISIDHPFNQAVISSGKYIAEQMKESNVDWTVYRHKDLIN